MANSRDDINLIKAFANKSRNDLKSAELLLDSGNYADAAYHAQQCSKKIIKCVLIIGNKFARTHLVSGILEGVIEGVNDEKWVTALKELIPDVIELEEHWILPRYPEPSGEDIWDPLMNTRKMLQKTPLTRQKEFLTLLQDSLKNTMVLNYKNKGSYFSGREKNTIKTFH